MSELSVGLARSGSFERLSSWDQVEACFMAQALTTRPVDNPEQLAALIPTWTNRVESLREVLGRLKLQTRRLSTPLPRSDRERDLLRAVHGGHHDELATLGIDVEYAWLNTITAALVDGAPFVEIEAVGPYAAHHFGDDGELNVSVDNMPSDERAGLLIASALRRVFAGRPNIRFVYLLDDINDPVRGREIGPADRDRYVVQLSKIFYSHGVLSYQDVPGRDYVLVRESEAEARIDELIGRLSDSGEGTIANRDDDVIFYPSVDFVRRLALSSPNRIREFNRRGIVLRRNGTPTCHALEAAGFLDSHNRHVLHVVVIDSRFTAQQDKTYALLRAIGTVRPDTHHSLFYDAENLQPETVALVVCELLIREIHRLLIAAPAGRPSGVGPNPARPVLGRHLSGLDRGVAEVLADRLGSLDLPEEGVADALDLSVGHGLYPAMLVAPYIAEGGSLTILDSTRDGAKMLDRDIQRIEKGVAAPWTWLEEDLKRHDARYRGVAGRLRAICEVRRGSFFDLPHDRYELVTSLAPAEPITALRREFEVTVRSLAILLRPGGVLLMRREVSVSSSSEWKGTWHPDTHLTVADVDRTCRAARLDYKIDILGASEPAVSGRTVPAVIVVRRP